MKIEQVGVPCRLEECPPGLFRFVDPEIPEWVNRIGFRRKEHYILNYRHHFEDFYWMDGGFVLEGVYAECIQAYLNLMVQPLRWVEE